MKPDDSIRDRVADVAQSAARKTDNRLDSFGKQLKKAAPEVRRDAERVGARVAQAVEDGVRWLSKTLRGPTTKRSPGAPAGTPGDTSIRRPQRPRGFREPVRPSNRNVNDRSPHLAQELH